MAATAVVGKHPTGKHSCLLGVPPYLDMFKLVHYVALTFGKWAVGIRLKCLLIFTDRKGRLYFHRRVSFCPQSALWKVGHLRRAFCPQSALWKVGHLRRGRYASYWNAFLFSQ